jgi:hypothetical protein
MTKLGKYVWQFFGLYFIGYLMGMMAIVLLGNSLNISIHDLPIIFALSVTLPHYITKKFAKNEGRIFNESEQRIIIIRTTFVAWLVSDMLSVVFIGYCITLKVMFSSVEITSIFSAANISADSLESKLVTIPIQYLVIILIGISLVYYLLIYFCIRQNFKKAALKYNKNNEKDHAMNSELKNIAKKKLLPNPYRRLYRRLVILSLSIIVYLFFHFLGFW